MNYIEMGYWSLILGTTYVYRYNLLKWCNYNYIRLKDKWEIYNREETIQYIKNFNINDNSYFEYKIFNNKFISFSKDFNNIDIENYKQFIESSKIPNIPEHIISAEANIVDDSDKIKSIDILELIQLLCGPYIDQITEDNKYFIQDYIIDSLVNVKKIDKIEVMYTDGEEIELNFN